MISIENRTAFAKAEAKAREVKPFVREIKFGQYEVSGGNKYTVTFSKDQDGHWQAECNCQAHTKSKNPLPCYHIPAAYQLFRIQRNIRRDTKAATEAAPEPELDHEPVLPVCGCGKNAYAHFNGTWVCIDCVKEKQAQIEEAERLYPDLLEPIYRAAGDYEGADRLSGGYTEAQAEYDRSCLFG